ncbi:hypothetical protein D3C72_67760 [compost metagenome]
MTSRLKRYLFLTHRWLGVVACLFFAMWFISGVVMMYVGYPKLTERERLQHLPALDASVNYLAPARALALADVQGPLSSLRLANARAGQPVYLAVPDKSADQLSGKKRAPESAAIVIDALTGQRLPTADHDVIMRSAAAYAGGATAMQYEGDIDEDAFTHSRALQAHRPLHKVLLDDAEHTVLYISSKTGEVVRDATSTERIWNYAGAWIHWLYPFRGNIFNAYWTDIVIWLSIAGLVLAITGTVVGILRWRFQRPYRSGARTPYQGRMMRWHHITGLLFAAITITWIFSGLMSMNPWKIFDSGAKPLQVQEMNGGALLLTHADSAPTILLRNANRNVQELRWSRTLGHTIVSAQGATGGPTVLASQNAQPYSPDVQALSTAAAKLKPFPIKEVQELSAYDMYYYARDPHTMSGGTEKPLPILRVIFDDPNATWAHLDPATGAVLGSVDSYRRTSRWLFAMLHSWDWLPLLERRPLWDILLLALSVGGALLSLTAVVIAWRRLGKKLRAA